MSAQTAPQPPDRLAAAIAWLRAHGAKVALELGVNFALPFVIFTLAKPHLGDTWALIAAAGPPMVWTITELILHRRLDALALIALAGLSLSLLGFAGGGDAKLIQLRERLVMPIIGLVFLGSAAIGRPLIYQLARAATRRRSAADMTAFEALHDDGRFRRAMLTTTLAWGFGLLAVCVFSCGLVFAVSIRLYLLVSAPIGYGTLGLLTLWTFWYVRRAKQSAQARAVK